MLNTSKEEARILSIQSHVVAGYAGNKCAILALQLHGFEVRILDDGKQLERFTGFATLCAQKNIVLN